MHPKLSPYGLGSFIKLRSRDYVYVDKTQYIQVLEDEGPRAALLVRPRRFGKTLFANTLAAYYDRAAQPDFERQFAGTWIRDHLTPLAGRFRVLKFDFSGIDMENGLLGDFMSNIKAVLLVFCRRHLPGDPIAKRIWEASDVSPARLFSDFLDAAAGGDPIFLIIDEYDFYAGDVLSADSASFRDMAGGGFLKDFYDVVQSRGDVIARIFMTGVTAFAFEGAVTGFDGVVNVTNDPKFAGIAGFAPDELRALIPQLLGEQSGLSVDAVFRRMLSIYEGYRFSPDSDVTVLNSSMCLHYLQDLADTGVETRILMDPAFSIGLSRFEQILSLGTKSFAEKLVRDVVLDVDIACANPYGAVDVGADSWTDDSWRDEDVLRAMTFLGLLTLSKTPGRLACPNPVVKSLFFQFWFRRFGKRNDLSFPIMPLQEAVASLEAGDARPLLDFVSDRLQKCVGDHVHAHLNETAIQLAVCMAMNTVPDYSVTVEEEALGEGFTDLVLRPGASRSGVPAWLMEFKYLKKGAFTQAAAAAKLSEAKAQLERYSASDNMAALPDLRRAAVLFCGTELVAHEVF